MSSSESAADLMAAVGAVLAAAAALGVHVRSKIPRSSDVRIENCGQDRAHMGTPGRGSPSVARALSELEAEALAAIALALPASWVVSVEPPYGQISITPVAERHRFHRCWVASGSQRRIYRDDVLANKRLR